MATYKESLAQSEKVLKQRFVTKKRLKKRLQKINPIQIEQNPEIQDLKD